MIKIKFPDGSVKEFEAGVTGLDIAKAISPRLAQEVLSISINGEIRDLTRPVTEDAEIKITYLGGRRRETCILAFFRPFDGRGFTAIVSQYQVWYRTCY